MGMRGLGVESGSLSVLWTDEEADVYEFYGRTPLLL